MPHLTLDAVSKSYRDFTLGPVSTGFDTGVTALLGANGAGKTTLIRLMVKILAPDSGSISLETNRSPGHPGVIGYLPQDFVGPRNVTVRDYLDFIAWCRSTRRSKIGSKHVTEALERVGMVDRSESRIGALSGGMVRRVGVAQAILGGSDLLVLDEPTVGLDPLQRADLRSLIVTLAADTVIVVSTHLCEDVAAIASRVHVLAEGRSGFDGTLAELAGRGSGVGEVSTESVERGFLKVLRGREVHHAA